MERRPRVRGSGCRAGLGAGPTVLSGQEFALRESRACSHVTGMTRKMKIKQIRRVWARRQIRRVWARRESKEENTSDLSVAIGGSVSDAGSQRTRPDAQWEIQNSMPAANGSRKKKPGFWWCPPRNRAHVFWGASRAASVPAHCVLSFLGGASQEGGWGVPCTSRVVMQLPASVSPPGGTPALAPPPPPGGPSSGRSLRGARCGRRTLPSRVLSSRRWRRGGRSVCVMWRPRRNRQR